MTVTKPPTSVGKKVMMGARKSHIASYRAATYFRAWVEATLSFVPFLALLISHERYITRLTFVTISPFVFTRLFVVFHDACHSSFFPSPTLNTWLWRILSICVMSPGNWKDDHHLHHSYGGNIDNKIEYQWNSTVALTHQEIQQLRPAVLRSAYRFFRQTIHWCISRMLLFMNGSSAFAFLSSSMAPVAMVVGTTWRTLLLYYHSFASSLRSKAATVSRLTTRLVSILPVLAVLLYFMLSIRLRMLTSGNQKTGTLQIRLSRALPLLMPLGSSGGQWWESDTITSTTTILRWRGSNILEGCRDLGYAEKEFLELPSFDHIRWRQR